MNDIVFCSDNGQLVTTSWKVAEVFGKRNRDVLRDVRNLSCSKEFHERNFALCHEIKQLEVGSTKIDYFQMTKDGFTFLVMGYRGVKAAQFKEAYIEAFNKMEKVIKQPQALPFSIDMTILKQLVEATQVMATQINQMQVELNNQRVLPTLPALSQRKNMPTSGEQRISPRQCKYYTVKQIASLFGTTSKELNSFLAREDIQQWNSMKQRWELDPYYHTYNLTYTVVYEPADPDDEPREYMVWTPSGRTFIWNVISDYRRKAVSL